MKRKQVFDPMVQRWGDKVDFFRKNGEWKECWPKDWKVYKKERKES